MFSLNDVHPRDIILADPQYPDQNQKKVRPLLVISKSLFQQNSTFCVCVGLTSSKDQDPYAIPYRQKDVQIGKLNTDGHIMCKRLVTLRKDKVLKKIGTQITKELYEKVIEKLLTGVIETNHT